MPCHSTPPDKSGVRFKIIAMKTNAPRFLLLAALLFSVPLRPHAHAIVVSYHSIDLADVTPGSDLWRYSYLIDDFAFQQNQGFTVFFDWHLYSMLQSPPPVPNGDWDVLSVQPDSGLNSNGFYDGQALVNGASLADPFTIEFVWLGTGTPGPQPFTVYDTDFSTIAQGQTVAPEPSSAALLFTAIGGLVWRKRRRV